MGYSALAYETPPAICDVERAAAAVMGLSDAGLIHARLRGLQLSPSQIAQALPSILDRAKSLAGAA
jgi:hypothetical protein